MAITINTNVASLIAQKSLNNATSRMNTAMERLSTGLRINSSKDDAAGSAVSTKLDYKVSSLAVAQDNAQMGSSLLDTEEGTLDVIQSNMTRIRDLTEQAANGTYGEDAMTAIKSEIEGRLKEVTRIAGTTEFNGKKLLDGSMDAGINLQVGITSGEDSVINLAGSLFASTTSDSLLGDYEFSVTSDGDGKKIGADDDPSTKADAKVKTFKASVSLNGAAAAETELAKFGGSYYVNDGGKLTVVSSADVEAVDKAYNEQLEAKGVTSSSNTFTFQAEDADGNDSTRAVDNLDNIFSNDQTAQAFLDNIDKALANVTDRKTAIGAAQQRVASAMEVANVMSTNFTSANSLIKDADIAEESSNYIKNQILQQTASSLLATANQNPQIALQLI